MARDACNLLATALTMCAFMAATVAARSARMTRDLLPPSSASPIYYHFHNITRHGDFEAGHMRGNPVHWVERNEQQHGLTNKGHVQWQDAGATGLQVWDLAHGPQDATQDQDALQESQQVLQHIDPHQAGGVADPDPDCVIQRRQLNLHSTLITRDCSGNPLEPPGVRLSPGLPRAPPRAAPRPAPPAGGGAASSWRPPAEPGQATNVFLRMNKRGGWRGRVGLGAGAADAAAGALDSTAAASSQDHLRAMKHADRQLMFGDGSYQAASTPTAFMYKVPAVMGHGVKIPVLKGVLKGAIMSPVKLAPMKSVMKPMLAQYAMGSRHKPVVFLMWPKVVRTKAPPAASSALSDPLGLLRLKDMMTNIWGGAG